MLIKKKKNRKILSQDKTNYLFINHVIKYILNNQSKKKKKIIYFQILNL